ncbi:hypothetical protein HR45_13845 [Shewanella mangrovi]|uniref:Membrane anchored protein in chemotaxis locus n=1 Tax=Shewanella mangrovi TaxID=1515746 RepID=A0A094JAH4_9GAMM|nr:hypothetical protein [Shewanella mangrovi]KFZ36880.1 hypothetical protein HR45_13845 [Shewanella mangrovi]
MADTSANTAYRLTIFLLVVASMALATAAWRFYSQNQQLQQQVDKLQDSQVMLMVPKEQAELIANWMQLHPEQVASLLQAVKPVSKGQMTQQQALDSDNPDTRNNTTREPITNQLSEAETADNEAQVLTGDALSTIGNIAQGVNVVSLEHGGIIITTRNIDNQ